MAQFKGRWRGRVVGKNAGFDQRVRITGAASGSGIYAGVVGTNFEVDGPNWQADLQWNNGAGSGWQPIEKVSSYRITGKSGAELYASIGENGPEIGGGRRTLAYTTFTLTWTRKYEPQADGGAGSAVAPEAGA